MPNGQNLGFFIVFHFVITPQLGIVLMIQIIPPANECIVGIGIVSQSGAIQKTVVFQFIYSLFKIIHTEGV